MTGAAHPWSDFSGCGCTRRIPSNVIPVLQGGRINYLSSSEFLNIEGTTKRGPTLPIELSWHAMINIKNDFTMIVGGWVKSIVYGTSDVISENVQTFYYDHQREVGLQYFCQSLMTAILDIWLIYNN